MKRFLVENRAFWILALLVWVLMLTMMYLFEKTDLHLLVNRWNSPFADAFFRIYTEIGGSFPFIVAAGLLFYRYRAALVVLATQLIATLLVTPIKHLVDADRPRVVFEQLQIALHQVDGVQLHSSHSFPSGHTAAAFALFFSLAYLVKQPRVKFLFFCLACLAGYSRIYLSQHFTADVLAGSILGTLSVMIYYLVFQKTEHRLGEQSVMSMIKKKRG